MTGEKLREALQADPFVSFRLHFGGGREVPVTNPGLVVVSSTGRTAYVCNASGEGGRNIDILLVESIDFDSPPNSSHRTNGTH